MSLVPSPTPHNSLKKKGIMGLYVIGQGEVWSPSDRPADLWIVIDWLGNKQVECWRWFRRFGLWWMGLLWLGWLCMLIQGFGCGVDGKGCSPWFGRRVSISACTSIRCWHVALSLQFGELGRLFGPEIALAAKFPKDPPIGQLLDSS